MAGIFITFEGGEGGGKTTQLKLLAGVLRERGHDVVETREPGGTPLGRGLRHLLLYNKRRGRPRVEMYSSRDRTMPLPVFTEPVALSDPPQSTVSPIDAVPRAELLLMLADRVQHIQEVIRPSLDADRIVLCDRFADSTTAYQGYGRELKLADVAELNAFVCNGCRPALTFVLDLPVKVGLARRRYKRKDVFQSEPLAFHQRIRDGFLAIARGQPERVCLINAENDVHAVHRAILEALHARLPGLG